MPIYETIFVARQDLPISKVEKITKDLVALISKELGDVNNKEYWGLRKLAYPISKTHKAHYSMVVHTSPQTIISKIEHFMRTNEQIIRFLSTKIDTLPTGESVILQEEKHKDNQPTQEEV
jgi:small subunit ribosomal protein S6